MPPCFFRLLKKASLGTNNSNVTMLIVNNKKKIMVVVNKICKNFEVSTFSEQLLLLFARDFPPQKVSSTIFPGFSIQ